MDDRPTLDNIRENAVGLLAELDRRQAVVRDMVRGVARQYATGLYLCGRPGTAKTHTVRRVLEQEIREPYVYQRGHIYSGRAVRVDPRSPRKRLIAFSTTWWRSSRATSRSRSSCPRWNTPRAATGAGW